jgi:organic radical activating enzyme
MIKGDIGEIFSSIQGEGIYAGTKQIMVRFSGCNLSCTYCDTRIRVSKNLTVDDVLSKISNLEKQNGCHRFISFTGGEPLLQVEFLELVLKKIKSLAQWGLVSTYLETNGTLPDKFFQIKNLVDVLAMDIKIPSVSGYGPFYAQAKQMLKLAKKSRFVKIIVSNNTAMGDFRIAIDVVCEVDRKIPLIIQPVTLKNGRLGINRRFLFNLQTTALKKLEDVRIIPQIHRFLNIK